MHVADLHAVERRILAVRGKLTVERKPRIAAQYSRQLDVLECERRDLIATLRVAPRRYVPNVDPYSE